VRCCGKHQIYGTSEHNLVIYNELRMPLLVSLRSLSVWIMFDPYFRNDPIRIDVKVAAVAYKV